MDYKQLKCSFGTVRGVLFKTASNNPVLKIIKDLSGAQSLSGAQERTRTSTPLRAPAPEAGASTNSATWAHMLCVDVFSGVRVLTSIIFMRDAKFRGQDLLPLKVGLCSQHGGLKRACGLAAGHFP
jgi:hypothetical protein